MTNISLETMGTHTIPIHVTISDQEVDDIMDAAITGVSYWCEGLRVVGAEPYEGYASEQLTRGRKLKFKNDEGRWYVLDLKKFLKGLAAYGKFDWGDFDSLDAEAAVQHALFGELVYG